MKPSLHAVVVATATLSLASAAVGGQEPSEPGVVEIDTLSVFDTLYHLSGGGGNALALIDESDDGGVVLVDAKRPGWGASVQAAIAQVTDLPVTMIIATHAHLDHAGALGEFPAATRVIAHEHTRDAMVREGRDTAGMPTETFTDHLSLLDGPDRIELYYFGPAHTDGDIVVVFPEKGVAYLGDLFPAKATPVIDSDSGGSGVAFPETLDKIVAGIEGVTRVITGHGEFPSTYAGRGRRESGSNRAWSGWMTWNDVAEYAAFNRDFLAAVEAAFNQGKTVEDAANTLVLPDRYADYGMEHARANVEAIYAELAAR